VIKCGKCGRKLEQETSCVNPIDRNGRNLERVSLCSECLTTWYKVYETLKNEGLFSKSFLEQWAIKWENFIAGKYDVEKVSFT
jgi:hypothetical protein